MKRALPLVKPEGGVFMLDNSGRLPARYPSPLSADLNFSIIQLPAE